MSKISYYKIGGLGQSVKQVIEIGPKGAFGYIAGQKSVVEYSQEHELKNVIKIDASEFDYLLGLWVTNNSFSSKASARSLSKHADSKVEAVQEAFKPLTKYSLDSPDMQIEGYSLKGRNELCNFLTSRREMGFVVLDRQGTALGFVNANVAREASYIFEDVE